MLWRKFREILKHWTWWRIEMIFTDFSFTGRIRPMMEISSERNVVETSWAPIVFRFIVLLGVVKGLPCGWASLNGRWRGAKGRNITNGEAIVRFGDKEITTQPNVVFGGRRWAYAFSVLSISLLICAQKELGHVWIQLSKFVSMGLILSYEMSIQFF